MPGRPVFSGFNVIVRFELDRRGIAEIAVGPELRDAVNDIVETRARPYAISISEAFRRTGQYIASFEVNATHVVLPPEYPMRRVAAELANTSDHALLVEVGSENNRAHHVMRRTLEHLGGHLTIVGG
jgi:hypothetical protein